MILDVIENTLSVRLLTGITRLHFTQPQSRLPPPPLFLSEYCLNERLGPVVVHLQCTIPEQSANQDKNKILLSCHIFFFLLFCFAVIVSAQSLYPFHN